jgi:hypothetical protein
MPNVRQCQYCQKRSRAIKQNNKIFCSSCGRPKFVKGSDRILQETSGYVHWSISLCDEMAGGRPVNEYADVVV